MKRGEGRERWVVVDADGLVLGRLASRIALRLKGKHMPTYTPHTNSGDTIIVLNVEKVALTGMKERDKEYYRHTGYVGGIKRTTPYELRATRPERILTLAVSRMLSRGALGRRQMRRLKLYRGSEHPHAAQMPEVWDFGSENRKNRR
ncbi:MAG: 50S ribosomal protein L13 [Alphaproteobacteria bacterium]